MCGTRQRRLDSLLHIDVCVTRTAQRTIATMLHKHGPLKRWPQDVYHAVLKLHGPLLREFLDSPRSAHFRNWTTNDAIQAAAVAPQDKMLRIVQDTIIGCLLWSVTNELARCCHGA